MIEAAEWMIEAAEWMIEAAEWMIEVAEWMIEAAEQGLQQRSGKQCAEDDQKCGWRGPLGRTEPPTVPLTRSCTRRSHGRAA